MCIQIHFFIYHPIYAHPNYAALELHAVSAVAGWS